MIFGGLPGAISAVGTGRFMSTGACGGLISTALMFCAERLLDGGRHVAEPGFGRLGVGGRRCRRGTGRAGDRDLHGGGATDEHRFGAARDRTIRRRRRPGLRPRTTAPRAVGLLGPDAGRCAGQVRGGQRDHRERGVLVDFADRLAAAEPGQRLLGQLRCSADGARHAHPAGRRSPTAGSRRRRDRGEQDRRRGATALHGLMLRMCQ